MAKGIDAELMERAKFAADHAPTGKGRINRRVARVRYSKHAVRWATRWPKEVLAVLKAAEHIQAETERLLRNSSTATAEFADDIEKLLAILVDHPDLQSLVAEAAEAAEPSDQVLRDAADAVARVRHLRTLRNDCDRLSELLTPSSYALVDQLVSAAEVDLAELPAAKAAVELGQEIVKLRKDLAAREKKLDKGPATLQKHQQRLEAEAVKLAADIETTRDELSQLRRRSAEVSAESEHVEHAIEQTARRLRDLESEAKVVTAAVEEQGPAAARRLYLLFREATHLREFQRETEEAEAVAEQAREELRALQADHSNLIDEFNDLVAKYNDQLETLQAVTRDCDNLRYELRAAQRAIGEREDQLYALQTERDEVEYQLNHAQARGRPVSHLPTPSLAQHLIMGGYLTYGELADATRDGLLAVPQIGPASVGEIERALEREGLQLRSW